MRSLSHEERRARRARIAEFVRTSPARDPLAAAAAKFKVSTGTVYVACHEFSPGAPPDPPARKGDLPAPPPRRKKANKAEAERLLLNTTLSFADIAKKVGLSGERIRQFATELRADGCDLPDRSRSDPAIEREKIFIEAYLETGDFYAARRRAKIGKDKAKQIIREAGLPPLTAKRASTLNAKLFRILADFFDESLSLESIANKHQIQASRVSNILREARQAGIPVPGRVDGRTSPLYRLLQRLTLRHLQGQGGRAATRDISEAVQAFFIPIGELAFLLQPGARLSTVLQERMIATKGKLIAAGLIDVPPAWQVSAGTGGVVYALTKAGRKQAAMTTDRDIDRLLLALKEEQTTAPESQRAADEP